MNDEIGVYLITTPSGKCYVGMTTVGFQKRWREHRKKLRNGSHPCAGLLHSANKYGVENLTFSVLESVQRDVKLTTLQKLEASWWDQKKSTGVELLNGRPTATGSVFHTEASREKLRATVRAKVLEKAYKSSGFMIPHRICPKGKIQFGHICTECGSDFWGKLSAKTCSKTCNGKRMSREYISPIIREDLLSLLLTGEGLKAIGERYSVSAETVRRLIIRYGLYPTTNEIKAA